MEISVQKIAALLGGTVEGDPETRVNSPSKIEEGGPGTISFLGNPKYESYAYQTTASALLVSHSFKPKSDISATLIRVDDVYAAVAQLMEHFGELLQQKEVATISPQASLADDVDYGQNVGVGAFSIIQKGAHIGDNCHIGEQVFIGRNVQLGEGVQIYPGVRILHDCIIGDRCIIHSNAVIGSDGFGFAQREDGTYKKIPQLGNVVLESDVEVGAGTTIDRATMGSTIIRRGVKLDNLIQVAHNVEIGENTAIAAQVGIAGSTKIGKNCRIGGQVGFAGHLNIADGTSIQAQSGLMSDVKESNTIICGSPAVNYRDFFKSFAVHRRLPQLDKRLSALEKKQRED